MRRSHPFITLAVLTAALAPVAALAQNSPSNSRLMFDPSGMQDSRRPAPQPVTTTTAPATPAPATPATTGQSVAQQPTQTPATRQVIAPPPQAAPAPAPKQAAPKPAARTAAAPARSAAPVERVINDSTAAPVRTTARPVPREESNLGRLSLPQGSVGYEGKTQMQAYDMSDGRRVPGYENIQRNDSSYFGLSLRMPTVSGPSSSYPSSSSSSGFSSPSSFGSHGAN